MPATHVRQSVHPLLLLVTCSLLGALVPAERAMAQTQRPAEDRFASDEEYGVWNPDSPDRCRWFVEQYNLLTPKIQAANKAGNSETRNQLTAQRQSLYNDYWECVARRKPPPLDAGTTENVPGTAETYPDPRQTGSATRCGPAGGSTDCPPNVRPWKGSGWAPNLIAPNGTRYTREKIDVNIVDYVGMTGTYPTEVRLDNTGNRAYTHALGNVDSQRKTFTITSLRDKINQDIRLSTSVVIRLR